MEIGLRVPKVEKRKVSQDLELNAGSDSAADLLASHVKEWKALRKRWRKAAADNEERYKDSMKVLEDMFEK